MKMIHGVLSRSVLVLLAVCGAVRADGGGTRDVAGAGRFDGFTGTDALMVSAATEAVFLPTSGVEPSLPLADGVGYWIHVGSWIGLEGDGTLVPQGNLIGHGIEGATDVVDVSNTFGAAVALKSDGTIEGFGTTPAAAEVPHGLSGVVDVSIGFQLGLAVMVDGSVIPWGPEATSVPPLGNVIEVHCGDRCGIALMADGTVVSFGNAPNVGQEPAGLANVYTVQAGIQGRSFAAIQSDSTLVTWPDPGPFDGTGVVGTSLGMVPPDQVVITEADALPCGRLLPLAVEKEEGEPHLIKLHSYSPAASYQWKLEGVDLPGETKPYLYIDSVGLDDRGEYTVVMTNPNGSVETDSSSLQLDLIDQTIDFPAPADKTFGDADFDLAATASSGLPVEFSIVSGPATLSGATVSITGAGEVTVRASQPGDNDYDPAPDVDRTFTVAKQPATVTLTDLAHSYDGTPKAATATTDPAGLNVVVTYAGDPAAPSGGGDYAVVATVDEPNYSGTASDTLSIAQAPQSIDFTAPGNVVFGDAPGELVATATSGLAVDFAVVSGPASVSGSTIDYLGGGFVTVRALQAGDSDYAPAEPVEHTFNIAPAPQVIDFPAIGTRTFGEPAFVPAATATSTLPVGFVVVSGPAVAEGSGIALTGAGTVVVRAVQDGNGSWQPAAAVEQSFTVEKQAQTIDFSALVDRVFDSGDFTLLATASSELEVEFRIVDGPATVAGQTLTMTGAGQVTVSASQPGDDDFLAADDVEHTFVAGYSLTINVQSGGDVTATPDKEVYTPGETASLSMSEDGGFRFTGWGGDLAGTDSPIDLLMDGNKTVDAEFKAIRNLTVTSNEGGTVAVDPEKDEYLDGDVVNLTAVPDEGYELQEWQGDASGDDSPLELTLTEHTGIHAVFVDTQAPDVSILSPGAGTTNNQFAVLFGSVGDNHEVDSVRWERDGADQGALESVGGFFNVTDLVLHPGDNVFRVVALDVAGNEGESEVTINWTPDRTLSLTNPPEVREGKIITLPMTIESLGNVGGMTYVIGYDAAYLSSPEVLLTGPVAAGINQINTDTPGEVRITFALPATTLPAGELDLGTVTFRARSVPFNLTTQFDLDVLDVAGSDGNQISFGTHQVGAEGRILQRTHTGDINTNDRLDTGDAFLMQRMLAGFDEIRTWDHPLNDLNTSGQVDSGDVIRVLRTVVGLDPQPGAPQGGIRVARDNHSGPAATITMDRSYGSEGDEITVQVSLSDIGYAPPGASFTLDYPADALRLTDASSHVKGDLVPDGSFVIWNLQPMEHDYANQSGSISFVASSSAPWPDAEDGGVIAELVFKVQAGASAQPLWPLRLRGVEVSSGDGFEIFDLPDSEAEFLGQPTTFDSWREQFFDAAELADELVSGPAADPEGDGRDNLTEYGMGSDPTQPDGEGVSVEILDGSAAIGFDVSLTAIDLGYGVEVSGDLDSWLTDATEVHSTSRAKDNLTERITVRDLHPLSGGRRFLRVRFELLE